MPNKRDLRLDKYDIGVYAYRELNNFCKQYREKKRRLQELEYPYTSPQLSGMPGAGKKADKTARNAERAAILSQDLEMIEQAAMEAAPEEHELFLLAMTEDVTWTYMRMLKNMRMGQNTFNERRRLFYYLLAKKRGII